MYVSVAIERCIAVWYPHDYQNLSGKRYREFYYILPAVLLALAVNITRFLETQYVEK